MVALAGIDEKTAEMSQQFTRIQTLWMLPVFLNRTVQTFWRAQRIVKPYSNMSTIAFIFHVPIVWQLTEHYGFIGAAWALPINQWFLFSLCMALDYSRGISEKCWPAWSMQSLRGWMPLLRMGGAGTLTTMGEWWSWEICAGMAGTLGEVALAAHVSIQNVRAHTRSLSTKNDGCVRTKNDRLPLALQFSFFYFPLPFSVSMAATIRCVLLVLISC